MQKVLLATILAVMVAGSALYMSGGMKVFDENEDHPSTIKVSVNTQKLRSDEIPTYTSVSEDEQHPSIPSG